MELAPFLFTPVGFAFYELLRLYRRKIEGKRAFPEDKDYYYLMGAILIVVIVISYGIDIKPVVAALLFGFSLPSGLDNAFQVIGASGKDRKIDDLSPHENGPVYKKIIGKVLSRYFRV